MVLKKVLKSTKFNDNKLPQVRINTGEKSFPVFLTTFSVVNHETKAHILYDDYKNLSREEQEKYKVYPKVQVYNVFNIAAQTNLKETRPEMYEKLMAEVSGQARQRKRNKKQQMESSSPDFDQDRVIGFARNAARNTLTNLVYNVCRYEQIVRLGMN